MKALLGICINITEEGNFGPLQVYKLFILLKSRTPLTSQCALGALSTQQPSTAPSSGDIPAPPLATQVGPGPRPGHSECPYPPVTMIEPESFPWTDTKILEILSFGLLNWGSGQPNDGRVPNKGRETSSDGREMEKPPDSSSFDSRNCPQDPLNPFLI